MIRMILKDFSYQLNLLIFYCDPLLKLFNFSLSYCEMKKVGCGVGS